MEFSLENIKKISKRKKIDCKSKIKQICFNPSGEEVAVLSNNLTIFSAYYTNLITHTCVDADKISYLTNNCILISKNNEIKYLSLYDNKYLKVFKGHKNTIKSLAVNKFNDIFVSSCSELINLWDIRLKNPIYQSKIGGIGGFFGENLVLASKSALRAYDMRFFPKPIINLNLPPSNYESVIGFNNYFVVSSPKLHQIYDKNFELFSPIKTEKNSFVSFSPDEKFYICALGTSLYFSDVVTKNRVHQIRDVFVFDQPVFNPSAFQVLAADDSMLVWVN